MIKATKYCMYSCLSILKKMIKDDFGEELKHCKILKWMIITV